MARVTCTTDGFTDNWIEFSESWTRPERRELEGLTAESDVLAFLRRKATACHIVMPDGAAIETPEMLTDENLADCDLQIWGFIIGCQFRLVGALQALGNFSVRLSSDSVARTR